MKVTIVAAVARGGVIGREGSIPWRIPEDLARFRERTTGHAVVMGRRTWDSLPARFRPLPERRNVVVTRNGAWGAAGAERAGSLEDALSLLEGEREAFVIGGAEIYAAALPLADELALTEIDADVDGDARFPEWDRGAFVEVSREERTSADGMRFAFVLYRRLELTREPRGGQHVATMSTEMRAARETLDASLPSLRELSTESGTLELIVVRPAEGERETPASAELTIEDGLVGDRWRPRHVDGNGNLSRADQLTLMSTRMLELIAEPERWPLAGDNLLVDMGLDAATLPAGSRLAIGDTVVIEISEEPHTGCAKFSARFGSDALKFVNSPEGRELRLRGALAQVLVPGPVATGDAVRRL